MSTKRMLKATAAGLSMLCWCTAFAIEWTGRESNGGIILGGGRLGSTAVPQDTEGELVIPSELGGHPVTGIDCWAFSGCNKLTSVTIPDTVTFINGAAFKDCTGLTTVTIGKNVNALGQMCFQGCNRLRAVDIPDGVTAIPSAAFAYCSALGRLKIGNGVKKLSGSVNMSSMSGLGGQTVTVISSPFAGCVSLKGIELGTAIENVNWGAFAHCTNLKYVYCPGLLPSSSGSMPGSAERLCYVTHEAYPDGLPQTSWAGVPVKYVDGKLPSYEEPYDFAFITPQTERGLIAYYKFDGDARDYSGKGNDGTVTGATLTEDRNGNPTGAYYFGTNNFIQVPSSSTLNSVSDAITIAAWVRIDNWWQVENNWAPIICKGNYQYSFNITPDVYDNYTAGRPLLYTEVTKTIGADFIGYQRMGEWAHVSVTYGQDGYCRSYLNGQLLASVSCGSKTFGSSTEPLFIGKHPPGSCEYLLGAMDELRIYNRALSDAEIHEIYALGEASGSMVQIHSPEPDGCATATVLEGNPINISYAFNEIWGIEPIESALTNRILVVRDSDGIVVGMENDVVDSVTAGATTLRTGLYLANLQNLACGTYRVSVDLNADRTFGEVDYVNNTNSTTFTIIPSVAVTFISEGGTYAVQRYGSGEPYSSLPAISNRVNYDFIGWFTEEEDGIKVEATNVVPEVASTLYAHWAFRPSRTEHVGGTIAFSTTWRTGDLYIVDDNITIPSGVTLTIEPGVIVKFAVGKSLVINNGGSLSAIGTRALPIVFTSIKDDANGGDTNGDGTATTPQPGDWVKIGVNGGAATFDYAKILYSSRNETTGAINMNGGTVTFNNGEIAHGAYDAVGVESGNCYVRNTVIHDCLVAFRHWTKDPIENCVIYDCGRLTQGGGQHFYNCIFSQITETWEAFGFPQNGTTYRNCCFWNERGSVLTAEGRQDAKKVCGKNGNIWANPLFVNPEKGDFRIAANSPCVDAGDGTVAPEKDYYGLERRDVGKVTDSGVPSANGNCPDIGIHEVLWDEDESPYDIAPTAVSIDKTTAKIGDTVKVAWTIQNLGTEDVVGGWHDAVSLVSASGQSVELGEVVTTYPLKRKMSMNVNGTFTIPALPEGTWYARVNTNNRRSDVPEGLNTTNNVMPSAQGIAISVEATPYANGATGKLSVGGNTVVKFTFPSGTTGQIARVSVPAGLSVSYGLGFMPQGVYASGTMTATENGEALFHVPAGTTEVYLVMDASQSDGQNYSVSFEDGDLAITSVSPNTVPSSGNVSITINGAGFDQNTTVSFVSGSSVLAAQHIRCVSAEQLVVTFNGSEWKGGNAVSLRLNGGVAEFANAFTVENTQGSADLVAKLDVPSSVRAGRSCVGYVEYKNVGNCDMAVPIFEIVSQGQIFKVGGKSYTNSVKIVGLSDNEPRGVLRPGEPQRLSFEVTIGNSSDSVRWKLNSYSELQESASESVQLETLLDPDWVYYHSQHTNNNLYAATKAAFGATWRDFYRNLGNYMSDKTYADAQAIALDNVISAWAMDVYVDEKAKVKNKKEQIRSKEKMVQKLQSYSDEFRNAKMQWVVTGEGNAVKTYEDGDVGWYHNDGWYKITDPSVSAHLKDKLSNVLLICHGNKNSIHDKWISNMASIATLGGGFSTVLAVDWEDSSSVGIFGLPEDSAPHIPRLAFKVADQLDSIGVLSANLTIVGHSHGGHMAAEIAQRYIDMKGRVRRVVGLDTSPMASHAKSTFKWKEAWNSKSADTIEFFKSSWTYSMGQKDSEEIFGTPTFFVSQEDDFYQGERDMYDGENPFHSWDSVDLLITHMDSALSRHGYSHDWFASNFGRFGTTEFDMYQWEKLSGLTIDIPEKMFAGVIRGNIMECGKQVKDAVERDVKDFKDEMWQYGNIMFKYSPTDSMISLHRNMAHMTEYGVTGTRISDGVTGSSISTGNSSATESLKTGHTYIWNLWATNYADNLSIPYESADPDVQNRAPYNNWIMNRILFVDITGYSEDKKNQVKAIVDRIKGKFVSSEDLAELEWLGLRYEILFENTGREAFILPQQGGSPNSSPTEGTFAPALPCPSRFSGRDYLIGEDPTRRHTAKEDGEDCLVLWMAGVTEGFPFTVYQWELYHDNNVRAEIVNVKLKGPTARFSTGTNVNDEYYYWEKSFAGEVESKIVGIQDVYEADDSGHWSVPLTAADSTGSTTNIGIATWSVADNVGGWDVGGSSSNGTADGYLPRQGDDFVPLQIYTVQLKVEDINGLISLVDGTFRVKRKKKDPPPDPEDEKGSKKPKSCDPNEMVGPEGTGEARCVQPGEWMNYTIYFENKANATAAAQEVYVTNPLSEWLDWSTFEMGEVSFNNQIDIGLSGLNVGASEVQMNGTNYAVRTVLGGGNGGEGVVATSGVAHWYMRIVDNLDETTWPADPYAGFLPPNDPETHCGEGHITYRIKVRDDAPRNVVITNSATIVFDYNAPIETDPAWWNTVARIHDIEVEIDGVATNLTLIAGQPFGALPAPKTTRTGYTFDAWYTGPNGTGTKATPTAIVPTGDFSLYQNWVGVPYKVRFNANGGTGTMADQAFVYGTAQKLSANAFKHGMYAFVGWATKPDGEVVYADGQLVENLTASANGVVTLYAVWTMDRPMLFTDVTEAALQTAASVYDGYIYNKSTGALAGTIQVKVGKPGKDGKAAVKATVIGLDGKKKSLKAVEKGKALIENDGTTTVELVGGEECSVKLGSNGMGGKYGSYAIDGALNVFASKDAADKAAAAAVLGKWQGVVNVAWQNAGAARSVIAPYQTLSVTIANKGKAKVAGTLADGTKVSASSQLLVGDEWCCVPVLEPKKSHLAFVLWLPKNGGSAVVTGLADAIVGKPGTLKSGAEFRMDEVLGDAKYADYLPNGVPVTSGTKWVLPKAGKVQLAKDGLVDAAKLLENPSALKLTYTAKTGAFKGSFKAYSDVRGKPKGVTVNVTGVLVDGIGYGAATIKKVGSVPVTISAR